MGSVLTGGPDKTGSDKKVTWLFAGHDVIGESRYQGRRQVSYRQGLISCFVRGLERRGVDCRMGGWISCIMGEGWIDGTAYRSSHVEMD